MGIALYNVIMKKVTLLIIVSLIFTACSGSLENGKGERFVKNQASVGVEEQMSVGESVGVSNNLLIAHQASGETTGESPLNEPDIASGVECYPDGIHPIGKSIADQFEGVTTYHEVMNWFCSGAEFEDILNALLTQELSNIEAEIFLVKIADGSTWDEIWLELGITEQ